MLLSIVMSGSAGEKNMEKEIMGRCWACTFGDRQNHIPSTARECIYDFSKKSRKGGKYGREKSMGRVLGVHICGKSWNKIVYN
jgi:hypothetical protein